MNTCPVYRRSGGHSYKYAISGPIGSILAPNLDMEKHADLPFASTLCGSCSNVCPVKIDIHDQLYKWRQVITKNGHAPKAKTFAMKIVAAVLARPWMYRLGGGMARKMMRHFPALFSSKSIPWNKARELPAPPKHSFGEWYAKNRKKS
jgi:L-lactate dehydrogenase complex protein LldF